MKDLYEWCISYLDDAQEEGAIEADADQEVIAREAKRLEKRIWQLASSFVANEFNDSSNRTSGVGWPD